MGVDVIRTAKTNSPSEHIKKRSEKMVAEMVEPGVFDITSDDPDKPARRVEFHLYETEAHIDCYERDTLISCPANAHNRMCSHCNAAIRVLLEQTKEN